MPEPGHDAHDPLGRLDDRLAAFEAQRRKPATMPSFVARGASDGYRLIAQLLGGVFGGVGLGWAVDHFAHTSPFGIVGGLLIGMVAAVTSTIVSASKMSRAAAEATTSTKAPAPAPDDEDDEA